MSPCRAGGGRVQGRRGKGENRKLCTQTATCLEQRASGSRDRQRGEGKLGAARQSMQPSRMEKEPALSPLLKLGSRFSS